MAHQESGEIKQLKLRVPMELYRQLQIDAENRKEDPSARARHILLDSLMHIDVSTPEEIEKIRVLVAKNWESINRNKKNKKTKKTK